MRFSIKDFFCKCDQIRRKLQLSNDTVEKFKEVLKEEISKINDKLDHLTNFVKIKISFRSKLVN